MTRDAEPALTIRTDVRDADHATVTIMGEVDLETAPELERRLVEVAERGTPVVVDLGECSYMDSSGFRTLHRAAALGRVVLVIPPDGFLSRVVRLAGLGELMQICDDVAGASEFLGIAPPQ
jgi:anti-sigma B factor antagonist